MGNQRRNLAVQLTAGGSNPLTLRMQKTALKIGVAAVLTFVGVGGVPPYAYSLVSGSLPPGMGAINGATGVSTGTPSATGSYPITVEVQDSASTIFHANFELTVEHTLQWVTYPPDGNLSTNGYNAEVGVPYFYQMEVSGATGTLTWTKTVNSGGIGLPTGVTLDSATGAISGTPSGAWVSYNITFTVSDSGTGDSISYTSGIGPAATMFVSLHVDAVDILLPPFMVPGIVLYKGVPVDDNFANYAGITNGVPPYTFSYFWVAGFPPPGISVDSSGRFFGANTSGSPGYITGCTYTVTDSLGATVTKDLQFTVGLAAPAVIQKNGVAVGYVGFGNLNFETGSTFDVTADGVTAKITIPTGGGGSGADPIFRRSLGVGF